MQQQAKQIQVKRKRSISDTKLETSIHQLRNSIAKDNETLNNNEHAAAAATAATPTPHHPHTVQHSHFTSVSHLVVIYTIPQKE
jgi:hypothetical protein